MLVIIKSNDKRIKESDLMSLNSLFAKFRWRYVGAIGEILL